eukprot:2520167-Rhodomonas_salina.1
MPVKWGNRDAGSGGMWGQEDELAGQRIHCWVLVRAGTTSSSLVGTDAHSPLYRGRCGTGVGATRALRGVRY